MASRTWNLIKTWKFVVLILLFHQKKLSTAEPTTHAELWKSLLNEYNMNFPPDVSTDVFVTLTYLNLVELNTAEQKMVFGGVFLFDWTDLRLAWNESRFQIKYTVMMNVWKPVFVIVNNLAGNQWIWHEFNMLPAVFSNGDMQLEIPVHSECKCEVNAAFFPFDEQFCGIEIIGWPANTIDAFFSDEQQSDYSKLLNMTTYTGNGEWELVNYESRNTSILSFIYDKRLPTLTFAFKFKRRSEFYTVNFILPSVAMSVLSVWTFILPVESGERVGYSLTIMLAYSVLLTLFSSLLPSTSVTIPYIAIYLLGIMLICALGTSLTALSVHLYHRREPVPAWIKRLCCRSGSSNIVSKRPRKELTDSFADDGDANFFARKMNSNRSRDRGLSKQSQTTWSNIYVRELPNYIKNQSYTSRAHRKQALDTKKVDAFIDEDSQSHAAIYWREVSEKLDFVCFWFFLILVICSNLALLVLLTQRKG